MNKYIIIFIFILTATCVHGQKMLSVIDISNSSLLDVYAHEDRNEARAIFICDLYMNLSFSSNYDRREHKDLTIQVDTVGDKKQYKIIFPTNDVGTSYDGRILTIYCSGFEKYEMPNFNFEAGTDKTFQVSDPYWKLNNPYFKAIDSYTRLFSEGNYLQAKTQLTIAKQTPEYKSNSDSIDYKIAIVDSIIMWRDLADAALRETDYRLANKYYQKVLRMNPQDKYVKEKYDETVISYSTDCQSNFLLAEDLFAENDFERALTYYQKVVDAECPSTPRAQEKILFIKDKLESRKDKSSFFIYEFNKTVPIGFSTGTCKMHKSGGYFTLHTNADIFKAMDGKPNTNIRPEVNISFGWTIKIYPPVWILFGPGYSGCGVWKPTTKQDEYEFEWANAISPEIGIIVKYWHISVKYAFQYRFSLKQEHKELLGNMRHYIGIGVCW